jgi:hypothetical protein
VSDVNAAVDLLADAVLGRIQAKLPELVPVARRVLTLEQAAEYLSCSPRYVQQLVSEGKLRSFPWSESKRAKPYFDVRDLDAAIDAAKAKGTG